MNVRDDEPERGEGFFGRWIKRKAEARERPDADQPPNAASTEAGPDAGQEAAQEPAFDLSKLPSLEDITAETNLSDFMRREVPAGLRNAALRKAWALDPAIRDYVNPAREYAYDWNTPGGVPGNGPLEAGYDALKQVAQAFGRSPEPNTLDLRDPTMGPPPTGSDRLEPGDNAPSAIRTPDVKISHKDPEINKESEICDHGEEADAADRSRAGAQRKRHGGATPA
ncbi:MAG: DUF3306 domain-containing protein [Beijerinckiaceae bacterium]